MAAEADSLLRGSGSPVGVAHNVEGRAIIALDRGELDLARRYAAEAVKLFSGSVNYGCTAHALEVTAVLLAPQHVARHVTAEILSAARCCGKKAAKATVLGKSEPATVGSTT
jgi:hypothetical protein